MEQTPTTTLEYTQPTATPEMTATPPDRQDPVISRETQNMFCELGCGCLLLLLVGLAGMKKVVGDRVVDPWR